MKPRQLALCVPLLAASLGGGGAASAELLRMGGTGAATALLPHIFAEFRHGDEIKLDVIPGIGHSGGLSAAAEGVLDVAVAGRALNAQELALGLTPVLAFRTPFGLVTSRFGTDGFISSEVAGIFNSASARWADGSPIRIIMRPKSDTDSMVLGQMFPDMAAALEQARHRPEIPTAATDQDNAQLAEQVPGSLAGATFTQIKMERRKLRFLPIDGVEPSPENLERGSYPYQKTLYLVLPARRSAAAERFVAFMRSTEGKAALRATGNILIEN